MLGAHLGQLRGVSIEAMILGVRNMFPGAQKGKRQKTCKCVARASPLPLKKACANAAEWSSDFLRVFGRNNLKHAALFVLSLRRCFQFVLPCRHGCIFVCATA